MITKDTLLRDTLLRDTLGPNPRTKLRVMCDEAEGYVMVRQTGYAPFALRVSQIGRRYKVVDQKPDITSTRLTEMYNAICDTDTAKSFAERKPMPEGWAKQALKPLIASITAIVEREA